MCGFAGIAYADGRPVDRALLTRMTRAVAHRGPDDEGFHVGPGIGLGHRRLSIVDLSPLGRQPMANEDETVWVAFNGEIYNQAALRERLVGKGHRFRSRTDTEVLVHLYEERGEALVEDLRGMFAFALWDARHRRLLLARDRLGIKPLFYAASGDRIAFGSEVKALLADASLPRDIDGDALDAYLAQSYVAAPATLLRAVRQVEPGHWLTFGDGGAERSRRYWDVQFAAQREAAAVPVWQDRIEAALRDAVRTHLMADVPYGALLSGGLDSSLLVGLLVQEHTLPTTTFTADFREATFGEGARAREIADALGAVNHQVLMDPPTIETLRRIAHHADEPTADMSMIPFWAVCELARRHVKVALSGEGADEVFLGYPTYPASVAARAYQRVPGAARALVRRAVESLSDRDEKVSWREKLKRFARGVEVPGEGCHMAWRQICEADLRRDLMVAPTALRAEPPGTDWLRRAPSRVPLERMQYADLLYYLPSDMLVKADRMSMAHGLEIRVPYLDHPLVELAAALPPALKLRFFTEGKWILRRLARKVLPRAAAPRRGKHGFNVPFGAWLRGPLREPVQDLLAARRLRQQGLVRPDVVDRLLREHLTGTRDRSYEVYALLMLTLWAEAAQGPPAPPSEQEPREPAAPRRG